MIFNYISVAYFQVGFDLIQDSLGSLWSVVVGCLLLCCLNLRMYETVTHCAVCICRIPFCER